MHNYLILGIAFAIIIFILYTRDASWLGDFEDYIFGGFAAILSAGVLTFILFLFSYWISDSHETPPVSHEIYSLERDKQLTGNFTLGCGYIDEKPIYVCFEGNDELGFRLKTIDAEGTLLIQEDISPHYETTMTIQDGWLFQWLNGKNFGLSVPITSTNVKKIVIPKNSIIQQYKPN